jgi:hypothetical protein
MEGKQAAFRGASAIVSGQFLGVFGRDGNVAPEKALLLAVLEDAIHCLRHYSAAHDRVGKQRFREAETWINRHGRDWVFTFDNVCELLGIEPEDLRRKIFDEETSGKNAEPQSGYLNGSVQRRYPPKRPMDKGLVQPHDRRR